jgi:hypothetical protein
MKRSTAILQTANIMADVLGNKCNKDTAVKAIQYILIQSGIEVDELIDSAHSLIQAEIELNKPEDANFK